MLSSSKGSAMKILPSWLTRTFGAKKIAKPRPRRTRLNLEQLEERITPSTFTVTDLTDNPSDTGSIRYAIIQVNADTSAAADTIDLTGVSGTITLSNGVLELSRTTGPVTITGPGAWALNISGNGVSQLFQIDSNVTASISGLTVEDGTTAGTGGGVYNQGNLSVSNTIFFGNTANDGGGIGNNGGALTVTDSTFSHNGGGIAYRTGNGGGIYISAGTVTISGSTFIWNTETGIYDATNDGGGIYISSGSLTVSGSTFTRNDVGYLGNGDGGGIYISSGTVTVSGSTFTNNYAGTNDQGNKSEGGGICNDGGTLTVAGSAFTGNRAASSTHANGGGIFNDGATLTVSGSTFTNNVAIGEGGPSGEVFGGVGGGISIYSGPATISDSTFTDNSVGYYGGGIYIVSGPVTISDSTFTGNSASYGGGGGIYIVSGPVTISDSIFADNHFNPIYTQSGGGIYIYSGPVTISASTFTGNFANDGGGGIYIYSGTATISDSTVTDNTDNAGNIGGSYGGGIDINSGIVSLLSTIVVGNVDAHEVSAYVTVYSTDDIAGPLNLSESAYNLIGAGGSGGLIDGTNNNQVGVSVSSAGLSALGSYGGPTQTIALQAGSAALQAGSGALTTLSAALAAGSSNTTLTVTDPTFLGAGEVIAIDSEQMQIAAISGTTVTVMRGYNNTTASSHSSGANVVLLTDQRGFARTVYGFTDVGAFETGLLVTTNPTNLTVTAGQTATFTAAASDSASTVQWQVSSDGGATFTSLSDGGAYSGSATTTLSITGATVAMNGFLYQAVFTNSIGSVSTSAASLIVNAATSTTIISNPAGPLTQSEPVTFTATIAGAPNVGTVTFYSDPGLTDPIGVPENVVYGSATSSSTTVLPVGSDTITAVYSGGTGFAGSQGSLAITVHVPIEVNSIVVNQDFIPVNGASISAGVATLETDGNSGFTAGNQIVVAGFTGPQAGFDGTYTIASVNGNQITYDDSNTANVSTTTFNTAGYAISANSDNAANLPSTTSALEYSSNGAGAADTTTQRSMVESIAYTFNQAVNLAAGAVTLGIGTGTTSGETPATATPDVVLTPLNGGTIWVVTFASNSNATVTGHSIADGIYTATLNSSFVTSVLWGTTMTQIRSTDTFYRLFGDFNADGHVNSTDAGTLNLSFGLNYLSPASTGYLDYFDYFGAGRVNSTDSGELNLNFASFWRNINATI
jgi:Bacterial Ig-like domain (group 3)